MTALHMQESGAAGDLGTHSISAHGYSCEDEVIAPQVQEFALYVHFSYKILQNVFRWYKNLF
jgi:hypothetical protein